jgi:rhamnosyltransferase
MEYRQHDNNQLGANKGFYAFKYRFRKILQGFGITQVIMIIKILDLENEPFIKKWYTVEGIDYLKLALNSSELRRRRKDRLYLFLACLFLKYTKARNV